MHSSCCCCRSLRLYSMLIYDIHFLLAICLIENLIFQVTLFLEGYVMLRATLVCQTNRSILIDSYFLLWILIRDVLLHTWVVVVTASLLVEVWYLTIAILSHGVTVPSLDISRVLDYWEPLGGVWVVLSDWHVRFLTWTVLGSDHFRSTMHVEALIDTHYRHWNVSIDLVCIRQLKVSCAGVHRTNNLVPLFTNAKC